MRLLCNISKSLAFLLVSIFTLGFPFSAEAQTIDSCVRRAVFAPNGGTINWPGTQSTVTVVTSNAVQSPVYNIITYNNVGNTFQVIGNNLNRWLSGQGYGSGQMAVTLNFSNPVPAREIGFHIADVNTVLTQGNYGVNYTFAFGGGATSSDFDFYTVGSATPMFWNSATGVMTHPSNPINGSVAAGTVRAHGAIFSESSNLVSSITITGAGQYGGDLVAAIFFARVDCDFGDAPEIGYKTTFGASGPFHYLPAASNLKLGSNVEFDYDGQPGLAAATDAFDDGISAFPTLQLGMTSYSIPAANITSVGTGTLHAWIDFDDSGTFDSGEYSSIGIVSGVAAAALDWSGITVSGSDTTYARFRFTSDTSIGASSVGGGASDGEVEDYVLALITIKAVDNDFSGAPINGVNGGSTASVFTDDTLNGVAVTSSTVNTSIVDNDGLAGASINADGLITVPAGTPAGTYYVVYEICDKSNPSNCDTAIATIVVDAASITAVDDTFIPFSPADGGTTSSSVLDNDTLNGVAVNPADINLTPGAAPSPTTGSITMNPDGTITVAPGTSPGIYVYEYTICEVLNPTNCSTATATIEIRFDPVFDCGDVIGKVFDDENYDGYQNQGEPGIAGAVVVTANGVLITADDYGRFHVPCAVLPTKSGTNFILKVDARSLPLGYHINSENPRVVRLTAGRMSRLNFAATISNVIQINLNGDAFVGKTTKLSGALLSGLDSVVKENSSEPLTLQLGYIVRGDRDDLVRARIEELQDTLEVLWERESSFKLNVQVTFYVDD